MEYLISAPAKDYAGTVGGVQFAQGQARTDNARVVSYCRSAGYTVTPLDAPAVDEDPATPDAGEQGREGQTPDQSATDPDPDPGPLPAPGDGKPVWVAAAMRRGHDQAEMTKLTKQELVELLSNEDGVQS